MKSLVKRFTLGLLAGKRKYVWCLAIATNLRDLEEEIGVREGGIKLKSSHGDDKPQRGRGLK